MPVALHVAVERSVVDSTSSLNEMWLEQHFLIKETFIADSDDVSVWELILGLHREGGQRRQFVRHALNNLSVRGRAA